MVNSNGLPLCQSGPGYEDNWYTLGIFKRMRKVVGREV